MAEKAKRNVKPRECFVQYWGGDNVKWANSQSGFVGDRAVDDAKKWIRDRGTDELSYRVCRVVTDIITKVTKTTVVLRESETIDGSAE